MNLVNFLTCASLMLTAVAEPAFAVDSSSFPDKPITVIVSYPPGGTADIATRIVADELGKVLSVPMVIENRPGASGSVGTSAAVRASADGYTLLSASSEISMAATGLTPVPSTVLEKLEPLAQTAVAPAVLLARADTEKTVEQWFSYGKEHAGKVTYATPGVTTPMNLIMARVLQDKSIDFLHIPYNGGGRAVTDLLGGEVDLAAVALGTTLPQLMAKKVTPLAVLQSERSNLLSGVPSINEVLKRTEEIPAVWFGWFIPSETPAGKKAAIRDALSRVMSSSAVQKKLLSAGLEPQYLPGEKFQAALQVESAFYRQAAASIQK